MLDVIQITAHYSNAVFLAILPQISDFVKRAELPMSTPVLAQQVREFRCWPIEDDVGGLLILTNGLLVRYHHGYVNGFRTPRSYYNLQDPSEIPRFYGPLKLGKEEALRFARESIRKLGYTLKETFTDQEPEIDLPPRIGTNVVPHYRFQWKDPVFGSVAVSVEVDAGRKMVQEINLLSVFFALPPPRIAVKAEPRVVRPPISVTASNQFLAAILPKISAFAAGLDLPFTSPIGKAQVEKVAFVDFDRDVRIKFTNGYWFVSESGVVTEFNSRDSVYGRQPAALDPFPLPVAEYLGEWRLSENEAVELVRQALRKLGHTPEEFNAAGRPEVARRDPVGDYVVPRYSFRWLRNDPATGGTITLVRAEVDADKKRLKHLQLRSQSLFHDAGKTGDLGASPSKTPQPPLWLPIEVDTNLLQRPGRVIKPPNPYE